MEEPPSQPQDHLIIVGVDGSDGSERALRWAVDQATACGARVRAVAVWVDPFSVVGPHPPVAVGGTETRRLRHLVERMVREVSEPGSPPVEILVCGGPVAPTLTRLSAGADMLVLGTRGLGAVKAHFLGSVSRRCIQLATCPIVLVPPPRPVPEAGLASKAGADRSCP